MQVSTSITQAKKYDVLRFEMYPDKKYFLLDKAFKFSINEAWVEEAWYYECIDHDPVVMKDTFLQFVIQAEYDHEPKSHNYELSSIDRSGGPRLGSMLFFHYRGEDTLALILKNEDHIIDTIRFSKR